MDLIITILPVVTEDLPISSRFTPYDSLSRCKFSTFTTRQLMVEFYLRTFPRFPLRKKVHKSYFGKNRTHDFRTRRCSGYLLDHSGDECCSSVCSIGSSLGWLSGRFLWERKTYTKMDQIRCLVFFNLLGTRMGHIRIIAKST